MKLRKVLLLWTLLKVAFLCVFIQISNSFSPTIGQWRVLVPEAAVVQGSPAHTVSPLIHGKPIKESFRPNQEEEYVNEHAAQDDEQSAMEQLIKRDLSWASSRPRYPDAPDPRPTTSATDFPSTCVSYPFPVSPAWGTPCEDIIFNEPSTVPGTGIGEHIHRLPTTMLTDHKYPLLSGNYPPSPVYPTLYAMRGGMYRISLQRLMLDKHWHPDIKIHHWQPLFPLSVTYPILQALFLWVVQREVHLSMLPLL